MIAPNSKYKKEMFVKFVSPKLSKDIVQKIFTKNYTLSSHILSDSLECSKRKVALLNKKRCVRAKVFFKLPDMDKKCLELFKKQKLVDSAQFEAADLSLKAFRAYTKALFKRCSHIQSFKVPSIAANLLSELQKWNKYIVNFRDLKNIMLPISLTTLKDFRIFDKFSNLSGLRSLDITIVRFSSNKLEQLLQTIGSLHKLERLALTVTAKYTEAHGKEQILSKHLGSLVCLKEFIFRFHIISLTNEREYFTDLFIFLSGLRHLNVLETFFEVTNPSNSFLILNFFRIISSFDRLKILNLNLGVNVEPSQAHEKMLGSLLLTHLKELKSIKIFSSGSHDYFLIKTLALMAQNLEKLNVHGLKPTSEKEMLDFFNYLKPKNCLSTVCLDLKTSFEPKKLEELFDSLSKCKRLETLQIWNGSSQFTVSETTLDKISKSLKKMNKLKTLGIDIKVDIKNNSILKDLFKVIISLSTLQKLDLKINTKTMCEIDVLILFPLITRLESLILTFENSFLASNQYFNLFKEIRRSQIGYYYVRFAQTVLESPNRLQVARIRQ